MDSTWNVEERIIFDNCDHLDIGCCFLEKILNEIKEGTIGFFIVKREFLYSPGYQSFQRTFFGKANVIQEINLKRLMRSGNQKAACLGVLFRLEEGRMAENKDLPPDVSVLRDLAWVVAGPNTGADHTFLGKGNEFVVKVPRGYVNDCVWEPQLAEKIQWDPEKFSHRRNLKFQQRTGLCYKLSGSVFRVVILPKTVKFLSRTPAIIAKDNTNVNLIFGLRYLYSWQKQVRECVKSINFTPSVVGRSIIPNPESELGRGVAAGGQMVSNEIGDGERFENFKSVELSLPLRNIFQNRDRE